jgi:hypothetical protein
MFAGGRGGRDYEYNPLGNPGRGGDETLLPSEQDVRDSIDSGQDGAAMRMRAPVDFTAPDTHVTRSVGVKDVTVTAEFTTSEAYFAGLTILAFLALAGLALYYYVHQYLQSLEFPAMSITEQVSHCLLIFHVFSSANKRMLGAQSIAANHSPDN